MLTYFVKIVQIGSMFCSNFKVFKCVAFPDHNDGESLTGQNATILYFSCILSTEFSFFVFIRSRAVIYFAPKL